MHDVHTGHGLLYPALAFLLRHTHVEQRQGNVLLHRQLVDEVETLEHEPQHAFAQFVPFRLATGGHVFPVEQILPRRRAVQQAENVEQRGLAAARRPHDGHKLSLPYFDIHFVQSPSFHFVCLEHFRQFIHLNHRFHTLFSFIS